MARAAMKVSSIGWCDYSGGPANIVLRGQAAGGCVVQQWPCASQ
jgi:hypothetical protein